MVCFISAEFFQKLVSEVEDGANTAEGEQREVNNLYPLLMQHSGGRDSWNKGEKVAKTSGRHLKEKHNDSIMILLYFYVLQGPKIHHNKINL